MNIFLLLAISLTITYGVAYSISKLLTRPKFHGVLDHPNARSLHESPTPRTGGLAIIAGVLMGSLFIAWAIPVDLTIPTALAVSSLAIIFISLLDDLKQMPAILRISVHFGAAVGVLVYTPVTIQLLELPWGQYGLPNWAATIITILIFVWFTNLYNFMDGIDGLAAGMGAFGFSTFGILGLLALAPVFTLFSFVIAVACVAFLRVNFPPARIFMGDVGSSMLGFLAAGLILWANYESVFPPWVGMLIFSPFVVDATVTLFRRMLNRELFWQAHRSHFYQRLVLQGWTHRKTTLSAYGLMAACGLSALGAMYATASTQIGIIIVWTLLYYTLIIMINRMGPLNRDPREANETDTTA